MSSSKNVSVRRRISLALAALPSLALFAVAVGACSDDSVIPLPIFEGGPTTPNENEAGDATNASEAGDASTDAPVNETSTDATTDGSTTATNLVISQVQSRGTGGGNDEFIEIYNPTASSITFDATWSVTDRNATGGLGSCTTAASTLYTGTGQVIASHKHLLLTTSSYSGSVVGDATYSAGISDAASIVLVQSSATIDALCFSYDSTTTTTLTTCSTPYICEGTPATNPHDNTTGTDTDASLERKPGNTGGNGVDSNNNTNDFSSVAADDPHDLASAAVP
jgi:hypothetical protein